MAFRVWQLLVLAASVGLLFGVTSTTANAASFGVHAVKAKSVHSLLANRFTLGESKFDSMDHHRWNPLPTWHPSPTTTTTTTTTSTTDPPTTTSSPPVNSEYPVGVADSLEPSGMAPPTSDALAGYSQDYVSDFTGTTLPRGWDTFAGQPGGDPGAQWAATHVVVSGGLLQLNAWQDPAYGNEWVTGAVCQCGLSQTYGAYFVRSRVTGPGPTNVELLWPTVGWPPEMDFNETWGLTTATSATIHWSSANTQDRRTLNDVDMTQWHTWGVIWTPSEVIYTVDGKVWGSVTKGNEISSQPMTLDLTQQTWCASGWACPTDPASMQIDWVAEYVPQS